MDYENKNKDAISTIKQALRQLATNGVPVGNMIKAINDIEEKYAESEDERIRNFLIKQANSVLDSITDDEEEVPAWKSALAWLEKQGEQKPTIEMITPEESLGVDSDTYNKIVDECIYGEQKLTDKVNSNLLTVERAKEISPFMRSGFENESTDNVEPKFHEGDWIVHHGTENVYQVVALIDNQYQLKYGDNYTVQKCDDVDRCARLWDITKDAKDGDVLVSEYPLYGLGTWYCIFKSLDGDESMTVYCYLTRDGRFETKKELCFDKDPYNTKPATKEQRDQLEKAMSDAGYKWDAEHRLLRKIESRQEELTEFEKAVKQVMEEAIECGDTYNLKADADMLLRLVQKSSWSEEDEEQLDRALYMMEQLNMTKSWDDVYNWLKSFKERVQPKQEWSEEDKEIIETICEEGDLKPSERVWLKSLKERYTWRPSYEQVSVLEFVIEDIEKDSIRYRVLNSVLKDLKKLSEK